MCMQIFITQISFIVKSGCKKRVWHESTCTQGNFLISFFIRKITADVRLCHSLFLSLSRLCARFACKAKNNHKPIYLLTCKLYGFLQCVTCGH